MSFVCACGAWLGHFFWRYSAAAIDSPTRVSMALRSVLRICFWVFIGRETTWEIVVVKAAIGIVTLNQSAGMREVFGDCKQQRRVGIQLECILHQPRANRRLTDRYDAMLD